MELARARMMDAVPTADVVVTNPTHFSVALKYTGDNPAPIVVAKGTDLLALRIRARPPPHGVAVVPDPPLARALYASVDVGRMIPEELFQARRPAARLRLPRRRSEGRRRMNLPEEGLAPLRPGRRRRRRAGRGDDGHPAAAVPARPAHHAEHLGGADDRRGDALRAAGARLQLVPEPAAAHHAVPAGDQHLGHAPDPAARRRRPRRRRRSATSSSAATWSSAS